MDNTPKHTWTDERKNRLKNRILNSATQEKRISARRKRNIILVAAAVVPLLLVVGSKFLMPHEPTLDDFVKSMPVTDVSESDKVTVILGQGEKVAMEDEEGRVEYSNSGSNITLGSGKNLSQEAIQDNKPIFNTVIVPYGKRSFVKLSDGTMVWINSGSKIVYPAVFKGDKREVFLEGEAIFEVAHNKEKPFRVKSATQVIEVLGTVFNVSHYSDDELMNTVLKSGSIRMTYMNDEDSSFIMKPGTLSSFNKEAKAVSVKQVDPNDYFSWREGFMSLNNNSLKDIANRISRYYNVPISIKGEALEHVTFSGRLDLSEDIYKVLNTVKESAGFNIVKNSETIILTQ
ncbi:MAG: FecR domain-containing protein [Bacteroidota bacterium]|nr:FecR domain-containing protein [Bacteroidota bacterium]